MKTKEDFENAAAALTALGVEYTCETRYESGPDKDEAVADDNGPLGQREGESDGAFLRRVHGLASDGNWIDVPLFKSVHLPFTPEEWCDLQMQDGTHYTGGSHWGDSVLEILYRTMRHGCGWIEMEKLAELAELWQRRSAPDEDLPNFHALGDYASIGTRWSTLNPWQRAAAIWHLTKDFCILDTPHTADIQNPDFEDTLRLLSKSLDGLWMDLFMDYGKSGAPESQSEAHRRMLTYKLLPPLAELRKKIHELELPPISGYGIIENETGEFAYNGYGYCLYYTRAEAERMLTIWADDEEKRKLLRSANADDSADHVEDDDDEEDDDDDGSVGKRKKPTQKLPVRERCRIRQVRVSVEKGLELIDETASN